MRKTRLSATAVHGVKDRRKAAFSNPCAVCETKLRFVSEASLAAWIPDGANAQTRLRQPLSAAPRSTAAPNLGPTRAQKAWATLGVNGLTLAENAPKREFVGMRRLSALVYNLRRALNILGVEAMVAAVRA
jgi:hypothetical protein